MYSSPFTNNLHQKAPSQFKENARTAIYNQIPPSNNLNAHDPNKKIPRLQPSASSIRSAPSQYFKNSYKLLLHRSRTTPTSSSSSSASSSSSSSSIFSSLTNNGKRSIRSAPSIYSSSTATIPEDFEPITTTVEQLINDIALHEQHFEREFEAKKQREALPLYNSPTFDPDETFKISLGSGLTFQNDLQSNFLIDWNLNVTRCKLILINLPMISSASTTQQQLCYNQHYPPQLVGDLAKVVQLIIIQPHITDKELIFTLVQSNIYKEHNLDLAFRKSVAEILVKQSRLLQINSLRQNTNSELQHNLSINTNVLNEHHDFLKFKYKEIAVRNYLINLAAAATTAHEYKLRVDEIKKQLKEGKHAAAIAGNIINQGYTENGGGQVVEGMGKDSTGTVPAPGKRKLSKEEKKVLWDQVRLDVFKRAGLEE